MTDERASFDEDMAQLLAEQAEFEAYNGRPAARAVRIEPRDVVEPPLVVEAPTTAAAAAPTAAKPKKPSLFAQRMQLKSKADVVDASNVSVVVKEVVAERMPSASNCAERSFSDGRSFPNAEEIEFDALQPVGSKPRRRDNKAAETLLPIENWMQDIPESTSATSSSVLRFDFDGVVLGADAAVPASGGALFHHGNEESRPGYSIGELMHLCKSTVLAQRLLAATVVLRIVARFDAFDAAARKSIVEAFSLRGMELLQIVRHLLDSDAKTQLCLIAVELLRALLSCGTFRVADARRVAAATGMQPLPSALAANQMRLLDGLSMRLCIRRLMEMELVPRLRFLRGLGVAGVDECLLLLAYQCPHTAELLSTHGLSAAGDAPPPASLAPVTASLDDTLAVGESLFVESLSDTDVERLIELHELSRAVAHWARETRGVGAAHARVLAVVRRLLDVLAPHIALAANAMSPPWTTFPALIGAHRWLRAAGLDELPRDALIRACCVGIRCPGDSVSLTQRLFTAFGAALELSDGAAATLAALYAESEALRGGTRDWPVANGVLERAGEAHEALLVTLLRLIALLVECGVSSATVECAPHVMALYAAHSHYFASEVVQAAAAPIVVRAVGGGQLPNDSVRAVVEEFCASGVAARFWLNALFLPLQRDDAAVHNAASLAQRMLRVNSIK